VEKVEEHISDALAKAQRSRRRQAPCAGGNFFEPTVLTDVPHDALIFCDETFGGRSALPFRDGAEAVRLANDTPYGSPLFLCARCRPDIPVARRWSSALSA